jgi:hypothetical protein
MMKPHKLEVYTDHILLILCTTEDKTIRTIKVQLFSPLDILDKQRWNHEKTYKTSYIQL